MSTSSARQVHIISTYPGIIMVLSWPCHGRIKGTCLSEYKRIASKSQTGIPTKS